MCVITAFLTRDMPSDVKIIRDINALKDDMTRQIKELADELKKVRVLGENRATTYEAQIGVLTKSATFVNDQYDGIATKLHCVFAQNRALT